MYQGPVYHQFARADFGGRDRGVGAITAFRRSLDGGEILLVVVAISQKQHMLQARPLFQAQGMPAKKFAGYAHEADLAVKKRCGQVRPNAFRILAIIEIDDPLKEGADVTRLDRRVCKVNAALKSKIVLGSL